MMDYDLQNVSDADYKRLIAEAYPSPKKNIHAAVMAQVTADAAHSAKKAKILTPAFRNRFVKYGSIAACFVLLVTLGFRILPMMTKDAVMESERAVFTADTASVDEAAPETPQEETSAETQPAAGGAKNGAPVLYKAALTDSNAADASAEEVPEAEAAAEPEAVFNDSSEIEAYSGIEEGDSPAEPEAPMVMMAAAPVAEEAVTEDFAAEEAVAEECAAEEAAAPPSPFESELKLALIAEIPAESYTAWLTVHGYTAPEHWSIAEFVTDHGISRERFTELYNALSVSFAQTDPDAEILSYDLDELYSN